MATQTTTQTTGTTTATDFAPALQNVVQTLATTDTLAAISDIMKDGTIVDASPRSKINFITASGMTLTIDDNPANDRVDVTIAGGTPVGAILPYGASAAPSSWLLCDGTAVSRTTYLSLFTVIGITYGAGDGSSTFNVPDLLGRIPVGLASAGHTDVTALGNTDGSALASRRPKHKTSIVWTNGAPINGGANVSGSGAIGGTAFTDAQAGPQTLAPTDTPAYLVVNYIIKT